MNMAKLDHEGLMDEFEPFGDLMLTLSAEIDQTTITYKELLELTVGRVIELQRPTGENIAVYAENVLLGFGEVLLINEMLTVRFAEIGSMNGAGHDGPTVEPDAAPLSEAACA
jgi:flagellar motor switch/type III secretory pathway protein FliN